MRKLLIIRFSSYGDIIQALSVPKIIRRHHPHAEIDWIVREDFSEIVEQSSEVTRVHRFHRKASSISLIKFGWKLACAGDYSHVYDAHNNVRSWILTAVFRVYALRTRLFGGSPAKWLRRPKSRIRRFLYFRLGLPTIPFPFRPTESYFWPLKKWGITNWTHEPLDLAKAEIPAKVSTALAARSRPLIALIPSSAWPLKRWPIEKWKELVHGTHHLNFVILAGPNDHFTRDIVAVAPDRVLDLSGQLTHTQSLAVLRHVDLSIGNDTGVLHAADQMALPAIEMIGPAAFGYPMRPSTTVMAIDPEILPCRPCSKDGSRPCHIREKHKCMLDISANSVILTVQKKLNNTGAKT